VSVVRKFRAQAVARFRRAAAADSVRDEDVEFSGIEWRPGREQLVRKRRCEPARRRSAGPVQQQDRVDDFARGAPGGPERKVVQFQLGQALAAAEPEIPQNEIAFALVRPRLSAPSGQGGGESERSGKNA